MNRCFHALFLPLSAAWMYPTGTALSSASQWPLKGLFALKVAPEGYKLKWSLLWRPFGNCLLRLQRLNGVLSLCIRNYHGAWGCEEYLWEAILNCTFFSPSLCLNVLYFRYSGVVDLSLQTINSVGQNCNHVYFTISAYYFRLYLCIDYRYQVEILNKCLLRDHGTNNIERKIAPVISGEQLLVGSL